ncbi:hypothetical protein GIB67_008813 [Kingdonia uniflora]|uniref:Arogenate dehydratase n=1 Tax=Kingdonia uniflora TaxID=39325 RepID=A0A7J7LVC3_9MAGN|nr:hypothetical protein GIB67_008813 [Kingdonia uniflora]
MALKGVFIWGNYVPQLSCKTAGVHLTYKPSSGDSLNLKKEKWEGLSSQRAIIPVEDENPSLEFKQILVPIEEVDSKKFYRDLGFLPIPLSIADFSASNSDGTNVRVAYQGVLGAYSEATTLKAYPECEAVPCDQFKAAFKAVELWLADKVVLPIENTLGGSIHRNYDLLLRHRLHIVGEALAQCEMYLTKLSVVRESAHDTADIYGLKVLAEKIQDDFENITRFLILAREPIIPKADKPLKTIIVFNLEEGPEICDLVSCNETGKYDDDQMLKSCGIKIDSKFIQVKGRVLQDLKLKVGDREDLFPRNEWWNFNSKKLVEPIRVNGQYLTNIHLKLNGNLGGLNSMLTTEHGLNIPMISKALAMMLGMDVSHSSLGQADVPYISKMVSSRQWSSISRHRACVLTLSPKVEMVDALFKRDTGIIRELLLDFYTSSGKRKPDQIIVFR